MIEAGVDPDKDIAARFSRRGALDETVYRKMIGDKTIDPQKARVFYTGKPFIDYVWTLRKDTDRARRPADRSRADPLIARRAWAHVLYRLERNVRASTVLGMVGAGGLGQTIFNEQ